MAKPSETSKEMYAEKDTFDYLDSATSKGNTFGYLEIPSSAELDSHYRAPETYKQKVWRHWKANPLVPVGLGVVLFALYTGVRNIGNSAYTLKMMKLRVGAQMFVVGSLLAGNYYHMNYKKKPEE